MFEIGVENQLGYGLSLLIGSVLALSVGSFRCARAGVGRGRLICTAALLPLLCAFFSHLFFCLVDFENTLYTYSSGYFFAFWQRGHMLYGGFFGAVVALLIAGGSNRLKMAEGYAPALALMAVAARIAQGFLGQGYGEYLPEGAVLCRFPFAMYDSLDETWAWALFVPEALFALALAVYLLLKKKTWSGDGMLLLVGLYASAQILLESLHRDEYLRWGFVRVEQLVSAVAVVGVLVCYTVRTGGTKRLRQGCCIALTLLMIGLCVLLEFAMEGRIAFLLFLDVPACYAAMACACGVMGGCVLFARHICNRQAPKTNGRCAL